MSAAHVTELLRVERVERASDAMLSIDVRRDGVAVIALDDAQGLVNTMTTALQAQLVDAIARVASDASIAAVVLTSGKPDAFIAGIDPGLLTSIKFAGDAERVATELGHTLAKLEALRKPVVAAIHGPAVGAGFGLALACHAIVASDDSKTIFGFPEVDLGIVSAGNGALRVAGRAGLRTALDLAVGGEWLGAAAAQALGLVDDTCARAILLDAAARCAKALVGRVPRVRDARTDLETLALEGNRLGRRFLFARARERARGREARNERRGRAAAGPLMVDVIERFAEKGFDEAARLEASVFGDLVVTETAHRLIEFSVAAAALDEEALANAIGHVAPRSVRRAVVLGGGTMGAGIALVTAAAGIPVRLKERDDDAVGRALRAAKALVAERVAEGGMTAREGEQTFGRLDAMTDFSGIRNASLVFEAVPEDLALKQDVLRQVEGRIDPRCVYASCTASLSITRIAQAAGVPERVVGAHYFGPVHETRLLEVVRADKSAPWAVATAVAVGRRQDKTVIVVRDGPGFYTTRILCPFLNEAVQMVSEGVPVHAIDAALVDWGFSSGPLQRLEAVGIDTVSQVAQGLHAAFGSRMTPPGALAALVADDRRGLKNGRGFYRPAPLARDGRRVPDPSVFALLGVEPRTKLPPEEIALRCALAMVNEAVRCLGDGVLRDPRDGDVGAVFGLGFPRLRGGPFRYVDTIGAAGVLRRVQGYAERFGERWRAAPVLVQMARRGERFFG